MRCEEFSGIMCPHCKKRVDVILSSIVRVKEHQEDSHPERCVGCEYCAPNLVDWEHARTLELYDEIDATTAKMKNEGGA